MKGSRYEVRGSSSYWASALLIIALFACGPSRVTREKWQQMSPGDKTLYVSALIGEQKSRQQKGGNGRVYSAPAEQYVSQIDAAYSRGDQRDVATIFSGMADRK